MQKYPLLLNILPIYSSSFGLSDEAEDELLLNGYTGRLLMLLKKNFDV